MKSAMHMAVMTIMCGLRALSDRSAGLKRGKLTMTLIHAQPSTKQSVRRIEYGSEGVSA